MVEGNEETRHLAARACTLVAAIGTLAAGAGDMPILTTDSMVRLLFTGDSQSCGRNLAIDFPQLMSRIVPARVINTAVGGSSSSALLRPMKRGTVTVKKGERIVYGQGVAWGMGPFPGMKVAVNGEVYTIDHIDEHPKRIAELHLCEPARADYQGPECEVEAGWDVRVAAHRPDVVCLMYINDGNMPESKQQDWHEMIRRIRAMGAEPVLMTPIPIDDSDCGGDHPGSNRKYEEASKVLREIATKENAWFVDVFNLTMALDPPLRCVIGDGIHPDTDGSTAIVNGLTWVFEQMTLMDARPFIKGWVLGGDGARPLPGLLETGVRPFHTSQPDHPDPDHQRTEGFTLEAIRRNDEYGLVAAVDGDALALGTGLLFRCGLDQAATEGPASLRLAGSGITEVGLWDHKAETWSPLPLERDGSWVAAAVPPQTVDNGLFHALVMGRPDAVLDAIAVDLPATPGHTRWHPRSAPVRQYSLASEHAQPGNLVPNPALTEGSKGQADGWVLTGPASVNRPFGATLDGLSFPDARDRRLARIDCASPVRPFDLVRVEGSQQGNDGAYRVRQALADGRFRVRKRSKAVEEGLRGTLTHNDGCGMVPGDCCVEVVRDGVATTTTRPCKGAARLRLALFFRAYGPNSPGTRDVPGNEARISVMFRDRGSQSIGKPHVVPVASCSYQWQKLEYELALPASCATLDLQLGATGEVAVQYTGVYVGVPPGPATE